MAVHSPETLSELGPGDELGFGGATPLETLTIAAAVGAEE